MSIILVIGYGNTLRRDDGLGQVAVQRIESLVQGQDVKVMVRHQMGIELAEDLRDADLAIFIDAHMGDEPGTLKETEVVPENAVPGSFSHHLSPGVLLGCVEALYNTHPETVVYSIAADSFEYGECLSPSVEATLPVLINKVLARITAFKAKGKTKNQDS
jgi:hydrogenase maturation protease